MSSATAARPSPDIPTLSPSGRVAIIGAGAFGRFCLGAYQSTPDIAVTHIADPDPAALALVEATDLQKVRSWEPIVTDASVEVVHLATPPYARGDAAFAALKAGKSLFCEKPIALTLAEADALIEAAERSQVALGVDYVMRHLPAYRVLEAVAASGRLGNLRSISFNNFAQTVPAGHWFWDRSRSGGILVEHGVHFFDAYGRVAGKPIRVWGEAPRREAIEVTVWYESGAIGRFFHEFAYPRAVERATGTAFFEGGFLEIDGWIPTRVHGLALLSAADLQQAVQPSGVFLTIRQTTHQMNQRATSFETSFGDRQLSYQTAIVSGMRDTLRSHRDPGYHMEVTAQEARASLALALAAQGAADTGTSIQIAA